MRFAAEADIVMADSHPFDIFLLSDMAESVVRLCQVMAVATEMGQGS